MGIGSLRRHYDDSQPEEVLEGTRRVEAAVGLDMDGAETPVVEFEDPGAPVLGPSITAEHVGDDVIPENAGVTTGEDLGLEPQDDAATVETAEEAVQERNEELAAHDAEVEKAIEEGAVPEVPGADIGHASSDEALAEAQSAGGDALELPAGNASRAEWAAYATDPNGGALAPEDVADLGRDGIRDLFAD